MRIIKTLSFKKATARFALFLVAVAACQPDNEILNSVDTQNVNSESTAAALMSECSDIATKMLSALTNSQYSGGRVSSEVLLIGDPRLSGALVTVYRTGTVSAPSGRIIIDFKTVRTGTISCTTNSKTITGTGTLFSSELAIGSVLVNSEGAIIGTVASINSYTSLTLVANAAIGVTDGAYATSGCTYNGVTRRGQIKITYAGKRWTSGSYYVTRLSNFYRNSAHIEGTESTTFSSTGPNNDTLRLTFDSHLDSGIVTFGDGRNIQRQGTLTKTWYRYIDVTSGKIDPLNGEIEVTSDSGTGTNKLDKVYSWGIDSTLVYRLSCSINNKVFVPVKGGKHITIDNTTYNISYGSGGAACDNLETIFLNGKKKTILITGDGN
jgi:hypothetical protein